jgi:hypothetical protein
MPLATDKYSGKVFGFMKSEELMVGEDSKPAGMCSDQNNTILMKIPEFKRSKIRIIPEFCGIMSGFPNQVLHNTGRL